MNNNEIVILNNYKLVGFERGILINKIRFDEKDL